MKVVFRTDGSDWIGSGHIMRCLTLAHELEQKGANVKFISRKMKNNLNYLINNNNFNLVEIDHPNELNVNNIDIDDYVAKLGVTEEEDANDTINILESNRPNLIIVDHYSLGIRWENFIRPYTDKIMVIDDLANRVHDCDFFLDQNWHNKMSERYINLLPYYCTKFFGPKYCLLRSEFYNERKKNKPKNDTLKKLFIYFGGSDPKGLTIKALRAISKKELLYLDADIVIGDKTFNIPLIKKLAKSRINTKLHIQSNNIAKIMSNADLAISSGGVNTWERMCLGIPSLTISFAENHSIILESLSKCDFLSYIGKSNEVDANLICKKILSLVKNPLLYKKYSKNSFELVSGKGAGIVSELLIGDLSNKKWEVKKATIKDCKLYFDWVNDELVRKNSFDENPISYIKHHKWFKKSLENKNCIMYKILIDSFPIGQVRFEINLDKAIIDYSISRQFRGRKLGIRLLDEAINKFEENYNNTIIGKVKPENYVSSKIFKSLGFSMNTIDNVRVYTKRTFRGDYVK